MSSSALGSAKAVWDQRRGARTTGDLAYVLYLAVMTIVVIGGPIARVAVQGLARPDVLPGLLSAAAPGMTTALWLLICAGLVLLGRTRGPAVLSPFFAATLAWSAMPRRVALTWPFLRGTAAVTAGFAVLCAVVGLTLETTGRVDLGAVALFALAGSGAGMLAAACWLGGQVLGGGSARILAAVLVAGAVTASLLAVPWGPGSAYPTLDTAVPWAFGLLGLGGIAVACSLPVLNRIRGQVLAEQARRWDEATVSATTGDLATAAAGYRALPTAGRRLPVVGSDLLVILYARRDLLALLRTPERSLVGAAGVLAAAFVLAQAMTL
ncbi:MAG: hypothetical protein Q4G40_03745, partial [Brachybacterium sp.]|nr:hypothetical protein [Brachybacterium sp.]